MIRVLYSTCSTVANLQVKDNTNTDVTCDGSSEETNSQTVSVQHEIVPSTPEVMEQDTSFNENGKVLALAEKVQGQDI